MKVVVSFKVEDEVLRRLDLIAQRKGISRSDAIVEALRRLISKKDMVVMV